MNRKSALRLLAVLSLALSAFRVNATPVEATWDTDEVRTTPVPYRYIHGLIRAHVKFQVLLPVSWNGKIAIFTRGPDGRFAVTAAEAVPLHVDVGGGAVRVVPADPAAFDRVAAVLDTRGARADGLAVVPRSA